MPQEILTRRNLPHWYMPGAFHFVTFRLAGSIPVQVLDAMRSKRDAILQQSPLAGRSYSQHCELAHKQFFADYDRHLDTSCTVNWLKRLGLAALVRSSLHHLNGERYHLLAYVVMPSHVHVVFQPILEAGQAFDANREEHIPDEKADSLSPLSKIMHSLKSYTAHEANKILARRGAFWQHESYDHWVRDEDELRRIVEYIAANPVRSKLVVQPHEFYFSSAHDRFLADGSTEGCLLLA